jgi:hypothetical protein
MQANVILCKCDHKHTFGIRVERRGNDWVRTWAFKIDEEAARNEGFDKVKITGSFEPTKEYPGCPYCGEVGLDFCDCGGINCASGESAPLDDEGTVEPTCNWCGKTGYYSPAEGPLDAEGGGR